MITDTTRVRRTDPGHPENCTVCQYQTIFNAEKAPELHEGCRTATLGCVDCKRELASAMNRMLEPMRERRAKFEAKPKDVMDILEDGTSRARAEAQKTMTVVRERLSLVNTLEDLR